MRKSLLNKTILRKEILPIIVSIIDGAEESIGIYGPDGSVVLGQETPGGERHSLLCDGEAVGYIRGGHEASVLAAFISFILEREAQSKAIAQHALEKYKEVTLLYDFSEKVGTCLDPREIVKLVSEESRRLIFADSVVVTIRTEPSHEVERVLPPGGEDPLDADPRLAPLLNEIWSKAEIVNTSVSDPRFEGLRGAVSSLMLAPLKIKDRVFGSIIVFSRIPYNYTAEDLKMLMALASPAAANMEVALLFDRLKRSEESYRDLFDGINDGVFIFSPDGRILNLNRAAGDQLRQSGANILERSMADFVSPENQRRFQDMLTETFRLDRTIFESVFRRQDGSSVPVEIHLRPVDYLGAPALLGVARDISERRLAEDEIRWKEALLRAMTSASPLAFYVVDNRTDAILYFNRRFTDIWRISHMTGQMKRGEVSSNDVMALCFPATTDAAHFRSIWNSLQDVNDRTVLDEEFATVDGRALRYFSGQIRDEHFNYFGRLHIFEDITDRKNVEAALKYRMEMERLLIGMSGRFMNLTLDRMDYEINRSLKTLGSFSKALRGSVYLFTPDGERLERTHTWDTGETPAEEGFLAVPPPLASWWQARLASAPYVVLRDFSDVPVDESRKEAIFPGPQARSIVVVSLVCQGKTLGFLAYEFTDRNRDWKEEDLALIRMAGEIIINALEREKSAEALREERALLARRVAERTAELSTANVELARASRMKDQFLANMSHELRTPLNAILGLAEALQEQTRGPLNERQLHSLRTIEESGRHLLSLINDILDLSKIEAGKMEFTPQTIMTEAICQASLRLIRQPASKKRIRVDFHMDPEAVTMQADDRRMKQILVNLLINAVKFTPENGTVGLSVRLDNENDRLILTVSDTGIGIPEERINDLFKPFVQIDSSLSRRYEGTGLGLALVSSLVELHGGFVTVESEVGKGSRFIVNLPWKRTKAPEQEDAAPANGLRPPAERPLAPGAAPGGGSPDFKEETSPLSRPDGAAGFTFPVPVSILLGEDNEANIQTLEEYLTEKGCTVKVAHNGREILEAVSQNKPDVILMDVHMPVMDGLETTRQLRSDPQTAGIPIIAVTSLAMAGDRERCLNAGVSDYLSKPVKLRELLRLIEKYMPKP